MGIAVGMSTEGGIDVTLTMLVMLFGTYFAPDEAVVSREPNSFSSFSKSSSLPCAWCCPSCWASWIRRCLCNGYKHSPGNSLRKNMYVNLLREIVRPRKGLVAIRARVRPFLSMGSHVSRPS